MREEIQNLLGKYFSGQASQEETDMVKKWADASEENAADFWLLEKLWNKAGDQEQYIFDTNKAWHTVDAQLQNAVARPKIINLFTRRVAAVAAAIILLLGAWWIFFPSQFHHTITADTAVKEVIMDDGTRIWLRKGATLKYTDHFGTINRNISLTGEAFFDVAHDTSLPFMIAAENTIVRVVGTSFLVNTNNNQVALMVKTGLVQFHAMMDPNNAMLVAAGQQALYAANKLGKENLTNVNFNAWQSRQLVFANTPLKQVAADLRDYYGLTIAIHPQDSSSIAETKLTAQFNDQSLQNVLNELSMISNYRFRKVSDAQYEISLK